MISKKVRLLKTTTATATTMTLDILIGSQHQRCTKDRKCEARYQNTKDNKIKASDDGNDGGDSGRPGDT
jgi:hypothetical protein